MGLLPSGAFIATALEHFHFLAYQAGQKCKALILQKTAQSIIGGVKSFYGFPQTDAKRAKRPAVFLLIAEKLFTCVSRSRTAGSISPVQRGLLRKRLLRSPRGDFFVEGCAGHKKQSERLFSSTLTPHLIARRSPCLFPRACIMAEILAAAFGRWGTVDICSALLCRWKLVLPYRGVLSLNC